MSRPLRIEYPDAWYHVMNRGRRAESIYLNKKDYQAFLDLMIEVKDMWQVNIAAYCLMTNHYHILLQTPQGNLARCMRHLNSIYTQRFNRRHGFDGPLFRGRYKSILVSDDDYLLQLVRYIHQNPVKAGMAKDLGAYPWSSYKGYVSYAKKWEWLYKDYIFSMITPLKKGRLAPFTKYMQKEVPKTVTTLFSRKNLPAFFGPESFITRIKEEFYFKKKNSEIPESKSLAPTPKEILSAVCQFYNVDPKDLRKTQRGTFNEPRNTAVYLLRQLRGESLSDIGEVLELKTCSAVSSVIQRVAERIQKDKPMRVRISDIQMNILRNKSQEQT